MPDLPATFHPLIRSWFAETYGKPTAVQAEAWPLIERGEHVLALAPTGSGKTLTAFLSAISRFCDCGGPGSAPEYPADRLTVLYVSPLKALNEDIRRNLLEPLAAIGSRFQEAGLPFPAIRVETRSGDTPQPQRRRFLAHPPSILALTPESLAILLLSPKGRQALSTVKYLILDEIHAVLGNKRGAFLSCQVDRLSLAAGEFQRISLSATVRPAQAAAEFVAGLGPDGKGRAVSVVAPPAEKRIDLAIAFPGDTDDTDREGKYGKRYAGLVSYILKRISQRSTVLVFTDSRRRAERLSLFINQEAERAAAGTGGPADGIPGGPVAFAHHGSLSKELRLGVESRLARGELPCVVATASLELGIDIGSVDEVVLAGSPANVSQALQRIGRSGHSVGKTSRGVLFPFHGMDLLLACALKGAVDDRDIEETRPVENPLDILAQIILSFCVEKTRNIEELYTALRGFYLFRSLSRESYTRTVLMLVGRGEKGRLREIKPRIWLDRASGEIGPLDGSLLLLYSSGGVIASRGLYSLRLADGTKIGELDEEFVWERRAGDCFHFGGRGWRITGIGAESVEARPLEAPADYIPFWKADSFFRSPRLTERVLAILDRFNEGLDPAGPAPNSRNGEADGGAANEALYAFLRSQAEAQTALGSQAGVPLAGSANITVEIIDGPDSAAGLPAGRGDFFSAVIHSFRGGAVNYPFALALAQELEETLKLRVESFSSDDAVLFLIPRPGIAENLFQAEDAIRRAVMSLNRTEGGKGGGISRGERLFRNRLETSGVFGAHFREAAERSLLLPKAGFGKRTPLWIMRQRSKRLFDAVVGEDGFPVTAEAWRSCLADMFDMNGFRDLLASLYDGSVGLSFFHTSLPSPFSRDMVRQETNTLIYETDGRSDTPGLPGNRRASLSDQVIQEALGDAALRPKLKPELAAGFASRLRREIPGWAPEDMLSLCEWVKERIAVPLDEWETLYAALPETLKRELPPEGLDEAAPQRLAEASGGRLKIIRRGGAAVASAVHREWEAAWENEAPSLLGPWLRYEGPVPVSRITEVFGISAPEAEDAVSALVEVDEAVRDVSVGAGGPGAESGQGPESAALLICDRENLEILLRLSRRKAVPEIRERPASALVPFLALRQGLAGETGRKGDAAFLKKLAAFAAPARLWETEFCTARCGNYSPEILDREIREGRFAWYGAGRGRIGLCPVDDLDLALPEHPPAPDGPYAKAFAEAAESGFFDRPRDFWEIKDRINPPEGPEARLPGGSRGCAEAIWQEAWAGRLSSDSFEPVRRGVETGFAVKDTEAAQTSALGQAVPFAPRRQRIPRALRGRWREGAPVPGRWFSLSAGDAACGAGDPLDEECRNRDRVRLLLARWGLLCRPLLERETPPFTWSGLLPAMRRMELSGELVAGRFFAGIGSLQFASPAVARDLENAESLDGIYWMNAADPASPAGLGIEGLDPRIPGRLPSNRLYFRGGELIAASSRNGRDQHIYMGPDDPGLAPLAELVKIPRARKVLPDSKILIETVNGTEAALGEYAPVFIAAGFVADRGRLCFW